MRRIYEFGEYQLDVSAFELRRAGGRVDVQPKVLRLLAHLIEYRERAVSGDELMRLLWPEEIVGDGSLKRAVCGARQAIGERGGRESRIRTVHRFGYQFVGPAHETVTASGGRSLPTQAGVVRAMPARNDFQWGALVGDAELLELLQRALLEAKSAPSCIVISGRAAGSGRSHLLDRLQAIAGPLGVRTGIVRCAPRGGTRQGEAFTQVVEQAGRERRPILIGLDDVHQCDVPTLRRVRAQLQALHGVRVLLVATVRAASAGPEIEALCAKLPTFRVSLSGVSLTDLRHAITLAAGGEPCDRLVTTLHNLSAGNPLFLRLLLGIWRTEGRETWTQLVQPLRDRQSTTTIEVFDLIAQYLRLLPEHTVRMLRIAALLGQRFNAERLATLSLMRPQQQALALSRTSAAGLITQDRTNSDSYWFVHEVVRAAVLGQPVVARPYDARGERGELLRAWQPRNMHSSALKLPVAASGFYSTQATKFWEPEMGAVNEEA